MSQPKITLYTYAMSPYAAKVHSDSTPIGLWLDELFPEAPRLLPEGSEERDAMLRIDDWISQELIPGSFRSYPGDGLNRFLNGWKLSYVMGKTAMGGIPLPLRLAWPLLITRVGFIQRLIAHADKGLPVRASKLKLYDDFVARLEGGPFLGGRSEPSLPDFSAYPQFALYYQVGFRGSDDILDSSEIMAWLGRMKTFVSGSPPILPEEVCKRELP